MNLSTPADQLVIGGFLPFTTIDFPTVSTSCVVFCQGCSWRCPYCQNKTLQPIHASSDFSWSNIFEKISDRKDFLEGVVFSGGEPLFQEAIIEATRAVKNLGLKVAIHTAGGFPERLTRLLGWIDWVGLDIKADFDRYASLTNVVDSGLLAYESLQALIKHSVEFECRTTIDPELLTPDEILLLAQKLQALGIKKFAIQPCYDDERKLKSSPCFQNDFLISLRAVFPNVIVRN